MKYVVVVFLRQYILFFSQSSFLLGAISLISYCSGFQRFWIPLGLGMSSPQLFLVQEDEKDNRFNTTSLIIEEAFPRSDGPDPEIAPAVEPLEFQFQEEEDENNIVCEKQDLEWCTAAEETPSVSSSTKSQNQSLGQYEVADDEDDDGFATPISSHHKIPVMAQCPPAPKKIRTPHSSSTKRKSPPRTRRHLHLDLSREVELMFPPTVRDDLGRKIKKARIED